MTHKTTTLAYFCFLDRCVAKWTDKLTDTGCKNKCQEKCQIARNARIYFARKTVLPKKSRQISHFWQASAPPGNNGKHGAKRSMQYL